MILLLTQQFARLAGDERIRVGAARLRLRPRSVPEVRRVDTSRGAARDVRHVPASAEA